MSLALMCRVFRDADDEGRSPIADSIAARWDLVGPVLHRRSSENFAFSVGGREAPTHYLRFNHESERTVRCIRAEIAFVRHLAARHIPVAIPVPSRSGQFIESVRTEFGRFHGSMFTALQGGEPDPEELDLTSLGQWGDLVGRVHRASEGFNVDGRPTWSDAIAHTRRAIPKGEVIVHHELDDVERLMATFTVDEQTFGLIHHDIDNCVWRGDRIEGIIDFDDCLYCWFEADIANALGVLFENRLDSIDLDDMRLHAFLRGYERSRPVPDGLTTRFPVLVRFGRLLTFARTVHALGSGPEEEEFEWTTKLREGCLARLADARVEFEHYPVRAFV